MKKKGTVEIINTKKLSHCGSTERRFVHPGVRVHSLGMVNRGMNAAFMNS